MNPLANEQQAPDDLLALAEKDGYELIDGQLVEKPMGHESGVVGATLIALLHTYVRAQKLGLVSGSDCGFQKIFPADPRRVRKPDISFIARGRLPNDRPVRGNVSIPPDLAVEVVSPNDTAEEIEGRVDDFMSAGTRLMWVVYPATASVWVIRKDGSGARLKGTQELTGEDVIPGFSCPVQAFFSDD